MTVSPAEQVKSTAKHGQKGTKYAVKRARILDAAASVFAEIGYMRASTGDIAARLGMRQSNLYYYLRSKDEALAEICLVGVQDYIRNITEILNTPNPFPENLRAAVHAHLHILTVRPDHLVTFLTCRHELPESARREVGAITREYETLLEQLIAQGISNGEIGDHVDPRFATSCLLALCHNPALYREAFLGRSLDQVVDEIAGLFFNGIARS